MNLLDHFRQELVSVKPSPPPPAVCPNLHYFSHLLINMGSRILQIMCYVVQAGFLTSPGKFKHSTAGEAPFFLEPSERTGDSRIQSSAWSPFQEADRHKSQGYIHSKSIIKLVLALKAKAIPLRSLTRPTSVLWMRGKMQIKGKDALLHVLHITITLQANCICWSHKEDPSPISENASIRDHGGGLLNCLRWVEDPPSSYPGCSCPGVF